METIKNILAFIAFCMAVVLVGDACWKGIDKLVEKIGDLFKKDAKKDVKNDDQKKVEAKKDAKEEKSEPAPSAN